jgi:hypothetical protein
MSNEEPCYLLKQSDWLEYEQSSSTLVKIVLVTIAVLGIAILAFGIKMDVDVKPYTASPVLTSMFKILYTLCGIMILIPVVLIILDMSVTYNRNSPIPFVMIGLVALSVFSILLLSLVVGIQIEISKIGPLSNAPGAANDNPNLFSNYIWIPVGCLVLLNIGLLVYRFKSSSKLNVMKQRVDWTNPREIEPFLNEIARQQYAQCGLDLGVNVSEDVPILAFANYIEQSKLHKGKFSKGLNLPTDRMPNIPKMELQLQADIEAAKNKKISLYERVASTVQGKAPPQAQSTVAERLSKTNATPEETVKDAYGNSVLYSLLSWPVKKLSDFTGISGYKSINPFRTLST